MTSYLLDTNALCEAPKKVPDDGFMQWYAAVDESSLFTSCLALGEIQKGILLAADVAARKTLTAWLAKVIDAFDGRIISVDKEVGLLWGELVATGQTAGKTPPIIDALIAAQCIQNQMTLVTRNMKDFERFAGLNVFCPWT